MRTLVRIVIVVVATPLAAILLLPRSAGPTTRIIPVSVSTLTDITPDRTPETLDEAITIHTRRWAGLIDANGAIRAAIVEAPVVAVNRSGYVLPTGEGNVFVAWSGRPIGYFFQNGDVHLSESSVFIESLRRDRIDRFDFDGDLREQLELESPILSSTTQGYPPAYIATFLGGEIVVARDELSTIPGRGAPALALDHIENGTVAAAYAGSTASEFYVYSVERDRATWRPVEFPEPVGHDLRHAVVSVDDETALWHAGTTVFRVNTVERTGDVLTENAKGQLIDAVSHSRGETVVLFRVGDSIDAHLSMTLNGPVAEVRWSNVADVTRRGATLYFADQTSVRGVRFDNS